MTLTRFYFAFILNELKENRKDRFFLINPGNFADKADENMKELPEIDGHSFKI